MVMTAVAMARGMSRQGLSVSSPKDAAPSKPANERSPKTASRVTVPRPTPLGSVKRESVKLWAPGAEPASTLAKMTTITISVTVSPPCRSTVRSPPKSATRDANPARGPTRLPCSPVTSSGKDVVGEERPDDPVWGVHHLVDAQIHGGTTQGVCLFPREAVTISKVLHRRADRLPGRLHQVGGHTRRNVVAGPLGSWDSPGRNAVLGSVDAGVAPHREAQRDVHRGLYGRSADLAVALRRVGVTHREQRPLHADRQVERRPRTQMLGVHVAAPTRGGHDGVGPRLRRSHPYGTGERLVGQLDAFREDHLTPLSLHPRYPEPWPGKLVSQEPKARYQRRPPPLPGPELQDLHGQYVARLRVLHVDGPADRVHVVEVELGDILGGRVGT